MVGAVGFEPTTSWSRTKRATKLRYAPADRRASTCRLQRRIANTFRKRFEPNSPLQMVTIDRADFTVYRRHGQEAIADLPITIYDRRCH